MLIDFYLSIFLKKLNKKELIDTSTHNVSSNYIYTTYLKSHDHLDI